jgi:dTDP-glucose pyrophosphorylase
MIVYSDLFVVWDVKAFMNQMISDKTMDAGISTFSDSQTKWSFAQLDDKGYVTRVAEKEPISNIATTGIYYWKHGSDFVKYANQMIDKDIRVNGEFYVCPVFNEAIQDGKLIKTSMVDKMWGLGTPEDLKYYLEEHLIDST